MAGDLSSIALSTPRLSPSPHSLQRQRGLVPHNILVPASASAIKYWQVEPRLCKLHVQQIPPLIPPSGQDADELASRLIFLPDHTPSHHPLQLSSSLLFFSHHSSRKQESLERDNFYANMGSAIRIIREETPFLFYKDLNYSIYSRICRDDITFRDPRNTFTGIGKYKLIFWALRFHGQIFFKAIWVEVLRVWQPSDRVIVVRWTVRGIPRVPWEAQGRFEGTSEYKLDENGIIYEHKVDNVAPSNPSYLKTPSLLNLLRSAPATPTPTYFRSLTPSWMKSIAAKCSTWERFYLALNTTIEMQVSTLLVPKG
ncbi:hypothetical protein L7F22_069010 [Adiantum nelumboides]|nr:hypothetical protein [Adiantum nelumboides]